MTDYPNTQMSAEERANNGEWRLGSSFKCKRLRVATKCGEK